MEVSPMWFVVVGIVVAIVIAYRHGKLAGFVAKVKADEAKFIGRFVDAGKASSKPAMSGYLQTVEGDVKAAVTKFGDELKGLTQSKPGPVISVAEPAAPQPTVEQRLASLRAELDLIRNAPKA